MATDGVMSGLLTWTGLAAPADAAIPTEPLPLQSEPPDVGAILEMCDRVVGEESRRNHVFEWLQLSENDSDPLLAVDAYYPSHGLVLLCQDGPEPYDELCATRVPAHSLRLLTVMLGDFKGDAARAMSTLALNVRLAADSAPPQLAHVDEGPVYSGSPYLRELAAAAPVGRPPLPFSAPPPPETPSPPADAETETPEAFVAPPWPFDSSPEDAPAAPEPVPAPAPPVVTPLPFARTSVPAPPVFEPVILAAPKPAPARPRFGPMHAEATARATRFVTARAAETGDRVPGRRSADLEPSAPAGLTSTGAAVLRAAEAYHVGPRPIPTAGGTSTASDLRREAVERALARGRSLADEQERKPEPQRDSSDDLGLGVALVSVLLLEIFGVVVALALSGGYLVLAFGLALDACARMLGTVAAARHGEEVGRGWCWANAIVGSPAVIAFAFNDDGRLVDADLAPLAGPVAGLAIIGIVIGLAGIPAGI